MNDLRDGRYEWNRGRYVVLIVSGRVKAWRADNPRCVVDDNLPPDIAKIVYKRLQEAMATVRHHDIFTPLEEISDQGRIL